MATHATSEVRSSLRRSPAQRISYDVGASCRTIGLSIAGLLAVFILVLMV